MGARIALVAALVAAQVATAAAPAAAHERRNVGPYVFVVGWLNEPAFAGQPNAATVRITDARETPAKAVEGAEKTLKIEVIQGGLASFTGEVHTVFGQPGLYALYLYPTVAGQYRYRVTGTVGTTTVNETFESGPATFNDVQPVSELQYPTRVPAGQDLARALEDARSDADGARGLAIAALALAVVALALAGASARSRRSR